MLLIPLFYTPCMGISRGLPLPIGHWWHHYYIIPLPAETPPLSDESSNQSLSHLDTPSCMHFNHQEGYPKVHSSSIFWRGNILCSKHTKHSQYIVYFDSYVQGKCVFTWCTMPTLLVPQHTLHLVGTCVHDLSLSFLVLLKMMDFTFEDVLTAIQSPTSIPTSVLQSVDDICLGDIHFAKLHTILQMCAMPLVVPEKWVENGGFNPEHMADADYSHSTAILLVLTPDAQLNDIESMGIGLIVCQCRAPLG